MNNFSSQSPAIIHFTRFPASWLTFAYGRTNLLVLQIQYFFSAAIFPRAVVASIVVLETSNDRRLWLTVSLVLYA